MFALESSIDELAHELGLDPLEMRIRNMAESDPVSGKPWHSKRLAECYERGAHAIGWSKRPSGGSAGSDGRIRGFGMATAYENHFTFPATARISLGANGTATVSMTLSEMGQGATTALTSLSAEYLGLPVEAVRLETSRTDLPAGAGAVASTGTYSNAAAILGAAEAIRKQLLDLAIHKRGSPLRGRSPDELRIVNGEILAHGTSALSVRDLLDGHGGKLEASYTTGRDFGRSKQVTATFGACFVEVAIDAITRELSVEHMVGVYAGGRIVEPTIAHGQLAGGLIWGLGQALMEESVKDHRTGRWTNANLAEALIPTQADVNKITTITIDDHDPGDALGMKGLSEIGVMGPGPAIANAIFDALGVRVRHLPIRIEDLQETRS